MRRKKVWVIVLAICYGVLGLSLVCTDAAAQVGAFECQPGGKVSTAEGKAVLDRVQKQYASLDVMHGTFRQDSYVAALEQTEASAGEVWFGKPGKMRWEYTHPQAQTVIIKGKELWLYQPDKRQVLVDDIEQVLLSALPVSFMMGVGSLNRDFTFKDACRSDAGVVLTLEPREASTGGNSSEGLEGFLLLVDEQRNLPKGAKITSVGGNITAIVFNNLSISGVPISASTFVLEYPKGVDVMDRRVERRP